jgi:hypothetical protein
MLYQLLTTFAAGCQASIKPFFGLVPWYDYLPAGDFNAGCNITNFTILPTGGAPSDVPLVFLAVVDDLLRI